MLDVVLDEYDDYGTFVSQQDDSNGYPDRSSSYGSTNQEFDLQEGNK
jgi:hypothetical protein